MISNEGEQLWNARQKVNRTNEGTVQIGINAALRDYDSQGAAILFYDARNNVSSLDVWIRFPIIHNLPVTPVLPVRMSDSPGV